MVCSASAFTGVRVDALPWQNWSGRVKRTLGSMFIPNAAGAPATADAPIPPPLGLQQLVKVVADATASHKSLHAIGSGWAFDDQAVGDDWTIDISRLRSRLMGSVGEALVPASPAGVSAMGPALTDAWRASQADRTASRKLVHVEAGIKLWQLIAALDAVGLALPTLGGANGQALAGVINTSVHGGDWNQPAFPGLVRAVHLVTDAGREVWIEPASSPVTTDARLRPTLSCATTEIIRSDEVFQAVLVGMGRFGVVYSYVLEVRPQFRVAEAATRMDLRTLSAALRSGAGNFANPFAAVLAQMATDPGPPGLAESRSGQPPSFFQFVMHTRNPASAWVQRRWETQDPTDLAAVPMTMPSGDLVSAALNAVFIALPAVLQAAFDVFQTPHSPVDQLVSAVVDSQMDASSKTGRRGRHAWITAGPPNGQFQSYKGVSIEVMFDANNPAYVDFMEAALGKGPSLQQVGWISLRPSRSTPATLSMHNVGGSHAVSIEIALLGGLRDNETYLTWLQRTALDMGGRLHWGQANNLLSASMVSAQYGALLDSWRHALWRVSGASTVFSTAFTRQRGLEPLPVAPGVAAAVPARDELLVLRSGPLQSRRWSPAGGWEPWKAIEFPTLQDPGPVELLAEGGRTHAYFIASDGAVCFRTRKPDGSWNPIWWYVSTTNLESPWKGVPGGAIHAVSTSPGSVHVLYVNGSGQIVCVRGDTEVGGSTWRTRDWVLRTRTAPGGHVTGVSRSPGQLDVFMAGTDRRVYTASFNSSQGWAGWWAIPGISLPPGAPIEAISRRADILDVFACDETGRVVTTAWQPGGAWKPWAPVLDGRSAPGGRVTAVSRASDLIDLFVIGTDGVQYSAAWDPGHGWGGWWSINGTVNGRPGAPAPVVSRSINLLDVFTLNSSGQVQTTAWAPGGNWGGPWLVG